MPWLMTRLLLSVILDDGAVWLKTRAASWCGKAYRCGRWLRKWPVFTNVYELAPRPKPQSGRAGRPW